jgi:hypothetical protein
MARCSGDSQYHAPMSLAVIGSSATSIAFAGAVQCQRMGAAGWRLSGRAQGKAVIVDLFATGATAQALQQLAAQGIHDAVLSRASASHDEWLLTIAGRSTALPQLRVFVHEDFAAQAAAAIPPRRVRWSRRLFWSTLLALLRTRFGRQWVRRRYGG